MKNFFKFIAFLCIMKVSSFIIALILLIGFEVYLEHKDKQNKKDGKE